MKPKATADEVRLEAPAFRPGRHHDKVTKQKHRIVEVKCIEQKGAPTS